jgi:hypothetical protein
MHNALKLIIEKIEIIEEIVKEQGSITTALRDEKLSKPTILMHLAPIAEQFQRWRFRLLAQASCLPNDSLHCSVVPSLRRG